MDGMVRQKHPNDDLLVVSLSHFINLETISIENQELQWMSICKETPTTISQANQLLRRWVKYSTKCFSPKVGQSGACSPNPEYLSLYPSSTLLCSTILYTVQRELSMARPPDD